MDKKSLGIGLLTLTATVLVAANLWPLPATSDAAVVVKDREYQVVSARVQTGSDALYILDNRSGKVAVFTYDPGSRSVVPRVVQSLPDAMQMRR